MLFGTRLAPGTRRTRSAEFPLVCSANREPLGLASGPTRTRSRARCHQLAHSDKLTLALARRRYVAALGGGRLAAGTGPRWRQSRANLSSETSGPSQWPMLTHWRLGGQIRAAGCRLLVSWGLARGRATASGRLVGRRLGPVDLLVHETRRRVVHDWRVDAASLRYVLVLG